MTRRRKWTFRKLWLRMARKLPKHLRLALGIRLKKKPQGLKITVREIEGSNAKEAKHGE